VVSEEGVDGRMIVGSVMRPFLRLRNHALELFFAELQLLHHVFKAEVIHLFCLRITP
jgi:hypothetical protein